MTCWIAGPMVLLLTALAACTTVIPRSPHPFDEQLEGQWHYECRTFEVDESLPVSIDGYAIYFDGRSKERLDVSVGTDCNPAARILTMRFEGTYRLGGPARVRLGNAHVEAVRDDEVKTRVTYELTPTFASVAGEDAACQALVGKSTLLGDVPALAQCAVTREFHALEEKSRTQRTVLFVTDCRLLAGDDDAEKDGDRYPTALDTEYWGVKLCPAEQ